jgi:hypothetical protein
MQTANIVHEIPNIFVNYSRFAIEASHCQIGSAAISNDHEYLTIGRTQIPDVIGKI